MASRVNMDVSIGSSSFGFFNSVFLDEVRLVERDLDLPLSEDSPVGSGGLEVLFLPALAESGFPLIFLLILTTTRVTNITRILVFNCLN